MVCGQIHAPATIPNYVHMHLMNKALRRQPSVLETWYVYFAMLCNLSLTSHDTSAVWATQSPFLEQSLFQSAKQVRRNNDVFCSRMFLLCTSPYLISLPIYGTPSFPSQNKPSHSVTFARGFTKHQLSLYHNLPMFYRSFHAFLTFSSDYALLQ